MTIDLTALEPGKPSLARQLPTPRAQREEWVFLCGLPPREEYLSFLVRANPGVDLDMRLANETWRKAAQVYTDLAQQEAGIADGAEPSPLDPSLGEVEAQFLSDPAVEASYARMPISVQLVPLAQLVVYQRQINVGYAAELQKRIGDWSTASPELMTFSLASDREGPDINSLQTGPTTFMFRSPSTDARVLDVRLVDAALLGGVSVGGRPQTAVVVLLGYGVNALSVISVNGRLLLSNGSHRAYSLMKAGFTHVPAVVQEVSHPEDLNAYPQIAQNTGLYLGTPRPPMLKDYFDPRLCARVELAPRAREIEVQVAQRAVDSPRD